MFIDQHRSIYGVEPICAVLPIAPSTYHRRKDLERNPYKRSYRARRDESLEVEIRRVWDENHKVYGARKVWKQLNREWIFVARCTVERLMRKLGLEGIGRGRRCQNNHLDESVDWKIKSLKIFLELPMNMVGTFYL